MATDIRNRSPMKKKAVSKEIEEGGNETMFNYYKLFLRSFEGKIVQRNCLRST